MKRMMLVGTALALLVPAVYAQTTAAAPAAPAPQAGTDQPMPPPPGPDGRGPGPGGPGMRGPDGPEGPGRRGPPPPPSRAAHFRLERGDTAIDIKCADDEPMKACSDIAQALIDKLAALPAEPGK